MRDDVVTADKFGLICKVLECCRVIFVEYGIVIKHTAQVMNLLG